MLSMNRRDISGLTVDSMPESLRLVCVTQKIQTKRGTLTLEEIYGLDTKNRPLLLPPVAQSTGPPVTPTKPATPPPNTPTTTTTTTTNAKAGSPGNSNLVPVTPERPGSGGGGANSAGSILASAFHGSSEL
jgi:hypothetical protein